ncbi:MAG: hypothetical protein JW779_00920 [Candidatus Thorarchaeota archaeon]|nr:hypothetical protein [Candidatus Thorarchaeota archaeon]
MNGFLYILTGPSGCGKTTLLNSICSNSVDDVDPTTRAIKAPKYSERPRRDEYDDIIHDPAIEIGEYDIAYFINGRKYGIKIQEIKKLLDQGLNAFIILSDFRVIRRLKDTLKDRIRSIYISSAINREKLEKIQAERYNFSPDLKQAKLLARQFARLNSAARIEAWHQVFEVVGEFNQDWKNYIPEAQSTEIRTQRIRSFHTRYIDNLHLFDHVILNHTENKSEEMTEQARNLILHSSTYFHNKKHKVYPPIFVVAAASGAGKGTLMEMLNLIGRDKISIVSKQAKRPPKPGDKRDGMEAIGIDGIFSPQFDLRWSFHKSEEFGGTEYAVRSSEIKRNINRGNPQLFVSNIEQFDMFQALFDNQVVFLYLHRLSSAEDIKDYQLANCSTPEEAAARIKEIGKVHQDYIEHIAEFDHVLLNTTYPEDLYDQMLQLIDHYHNTHLLREFREWKASYPLDD